MYINSVSHYLSTYMQALGYLKLGLIYQMELNTDDKPVYDKYKSLYSSLLTGNAEAKIESNAGKVDAALLQVFKDAEDWDNPHYATLKLRKKSEQVKRLKHSMLCAILRLCGIVRLIKSIRSMNRNFNVR